MNSVARFLYARAPVDFLSYWKIVLPYDGASESLTFLGTMDLNATSPKKD